MKKNAYTPNQLKVLEELRKEATAYGSEKGHWTGLNGETIKEYKEQKKEIEEETTAREKWLESTKRRGEDETSDTV